MNKEFDYIKAKINEKFPGTEFNQDNGPNCQWLDFTINYHCLVHQITIEDRFKDELGFYYNESASCNSGADQTFAKTDLDDLIKHIWKTIE